MRSVALILGLIATNRRDDCHEIDARIVRTGVKRAIVSGMIFWVDLVAGVVGGLAFAAAGAFLGGQLGRVFGPVGWGDLVGAVVGAAGGYALGAPLAMTLVRRWLGRPFAFWPALAASLLGCAAIAALAEPLGLNRSTVALQVAYVVVPVLAAALAQRRWAVDRQARSTAADTGKT